jgi:hypothetical protein
MGGVYLEHTNITAIDVPVLSTARYIDLDANPLLEHLDLPAVQSAHSISLDANPALASISAPVLTSADVFYIERNSVLPTCLAQNLAVQANATSVTIAGNDDMATCP